MKMNEVIQAILNGIRTLLQSYPEIYCEKNAGDNTNQLNLSIGGLSLLLLAKTDTSQFKSTGRVHWLICFEK